MESPAHAVENHQPRLYVPDRNDVVIFVKHGLYESDGTQEKQLIKRVIGLPGDRVMVADGKITVYNLEHPEGYNPDLNHEFSEHIAPSTTGNIDLVVPEGASLCVRRQPYEFA